MPILQIQAILQQLNIKRVVIHGSIKMAYENVRQSLAKEIAVFGSFYVAGEVLAI